MIFYPKAYLNKVTDIDLEFLRQRNIKGLLIDIDNNLITKNRRGIKGRILYLLCQKTFKVWIQ